MPLLALECDSSLTVLKTELAIFISINVQPLKINVARFLNAAR